MHLILIRVSQNGVLVRNAKSLDYYCKMFQPGHDVEGKEVASGRRLKTSFKFLILLSTILTTPFLLVDGLSGYLRRQVFTEREKR